MSTTNECYQQVRKFAKQFKVLRGLYHLIKPPVGLPVIDKKKIDQLIKEKAFKGRIGKSDTSEDIIISLTSFPARMQEIHYTIYSLLNQRLPLTALILWLSEEEFPDKEKELPESLTSLKKYGLSIRWIPKNLRSYGKIIPTLESYPGKIIITADDDVYYPSDWAEKLYVEHTRHPKDIIAHRAHWVSYKKDGNIAGYNEWPHCIEGGTCRFANFLTGVGGVLYPAGCLYKGVLKKDQFQKLAPQADDIWLWAMAVLNKTRIRIPKDSIRNLIYDSKEMQTGASRLSAENVEKSANDWQMRAVLDAYPEIERTLKKEHSYNEID